MDMHCSLRTDMGELRLVCVSISSALHVRVCDDITIADNDSDSFFVEISGGGEMGKI